MEYSISKEDCKKSIKGVCEGCGGDLTPIETVDNAGNPTFWAGCEHCSCFRSGIDKKYFVVARKLVEEDKMLPYSRMKRTDYERTKDQLEYYFDTQTATLSREIAYIDSLLREYTNV